MNSTFEFWVSGIIEDDPLPDEIDCIVFNVKNNAKYVYVEMLGYEKTPNFNQIAYRPPEAEWYSSKQMQNIKNVLLKQRVRNAIDECFASPALKQQFKKRNIYLLFNGKCEFLFTV